MKVHIEDPKGNTIYDRLTYNGGPILPFASGFGFVVLEEIKRQGWVIVNGWNQAND